MVVPSFNLFNTPVKFIPNLVHPETSNVPSKLKHPLISKLIAIAQFSIPLAVVHFTINFDVKLSVVIRNNCQVKSILIFGILGNCFYSYVIKSRIKDFFPIRNLFRI